MSKEGFTRVMAGIPTDDSLQGDELQTSPLSSSSVRLCPCKYSFLWGLNELYNFSYSEDGDKKKRALCSRPATLVLGAEKRILIVGLSIRLRDWPESLIGYLVDAYAHVHQESSCEERFLVLQRVVPNEGPTTPNWAEMGQGYREA